MSRRLPFGGFTWFKELSQFNEDFIENYNEDSDEGYFLEVDVQMFNILKIYITFTMIYPFP